MYKKGSNYANDIDNADVITLDAKSPALFQYRFSNGDSGVLTQSLIDPDNLDDGAGGLTAVGNNKWSVQRGYIFTSNNLKFQRGVSEFASLDEAVNGIATEPYVTEPSIAANGLLRGWLVVQQGATDLSNSAQALFLEAPKFPGGTSAGGASVTTLQAAYDNSTPDPEILTDSINGAVTFRRGSALDTDKVLTVQSGSGDDVFYVDGLGNVVGNSITASIDYSNINNVPDFVESSETSSMTVLSSSYAITASYALNAGGGNAYISQSGQDVVLGEVSASNTYVSGTLTVDNNPISVFNTGAESAIYTYRTDGKASAFGAGNGSTFFRFDDSDDFQIQGLPRSSLDAQNANGLVRILTVNTESIINNPQNRDVDFTIEQSGSGIAYNYDAGTTTHTFNGSDFKFSGSNAANDFDIIHLTSVGQPGMTIESVGGSNARWRLGGTDGIYWSFRKNGGNFFVTQDPGNINFVRYDNTSVDYNPDGEDHNFCIIQSGSTNFAYEYDAGLATHTFTGSTMTFNGVSVIDTGSGGSVTTLDKFTANDAMFVGAGSAGGSARNGHAVLTFDASVTESVNFEGYMPEEYNGGSLNVNIWYAADGVTTGNAYWSASFETMSADLHDLDADNFGTYVGVTDVVPSVDGQLSVATITFTQAQASSMIAGIPYRFQLMRGSGSGTAAADLQVLRTTVEQ
jgi:hypothetical protein